MVRNTAIALVLLLLPLLSFAQLESELKFTGQNADTLKMEKAVSVIRRVAKEVPSVCTRKVPYEVNECGPVTRYRQECRQVPAERVCRTEYDQECTTVTRTRNECRPGPSRQECHTTSSRQECSTGSSRQECGYGPSRQECGYGPSRQECSNDPGREVCVERPTREVCRTRPDGQQVCQTVGGGQHCTTVGGGQSCRTVPGDYSCRSVPGSYSCETIPGQTTCHTVPGEYVCRTVQGSDICRDVPYNDQECRDVPRQACENVPAHQACRNVPYQETVCGNVTRHRDEQYACTKTEYVMEPVAKTLTGTINVAIATNGSVEPFSMIAKVAGATAELKDFTLALSLPVDPKIYVVVKKKSIKLLAETDKEISFEGEVSLELLAQVGAPVVYPTKVYEAVIESRSSSLEVLFTGVMPTTAQVELELRSSSGLLATKKGAIGSAGIVLKKIERKDALVFDLRNALNTRLPNRGITMNLKLITPTKITGEILNAKKPQSDKLYEKIKVEKL